jgi:hypothetical protein
MERYGLQTWVSYKDISVYFHVAAVFGKVMIKPPPRDSAVGRSKSQQYRQVDQKRIAFLCHFYK